MPPTNEPTPSDRVSASWKAHARDEFLRTELFCGPVDMRDYHRSVFMERTIRQVSRMMLADVGWVLR